jgi:hypothetical protein
MSRARVAFWLATLILVFTVAAPPADAATLLVDCTVEDLRSKMQTALADDVLKLQKGCTYTLSGAADDDVNASGDLDFIGGVVTPLTIEGSGAIIDGGAVDRVIDLGPAKTLTIRNLTIQNGDATQNAGSKQGGGIFVGVGATLNLSDVTLSGNESVQGGAIFNDQGTVVADRVTITGNSTTGGNGEGGGLWHGAAPTSTTLTNVTINSNTAFSDGGGIFSNIGGDVTLENVTISGNTAVNHGGVSGAVTARNSLFAGNTAGGPSNCDAVTSQGTNLVQDATGCTGLGGSDIVGEDPLLGTLQNNGGKTSTQALGTGSPAINAGTTAGGPAVDQRGRPRPAGAGDIGAFEVLPPSFGDVPTSNFAFQFIEDLFASGVTSGCTVSPLNYCPDSSVTRGQMAVFIIRGAEGVDPAPPGTATFSDVPTTHPFFAFVERMATLGITSGCGPSTYCPDAPVTREQMAAFMIRALGEFSPPAPASQRFADVPPSSPFYAFIERMAVFGITSGCGSGNYCPTDPVTRAQMAVFLVRAFDLP